MFRLFSIKKRLTASINKANDLYCFDKLIKKSAPPAPKINISSDDVAMYQYTDGTTGVSKKVMLGARFPSFMCSASLCA
ncbi:MAG: long-chain fatty acid--CoA ligase [Desulfatiglans sp.]|nr:long-chain fatty acid--CoA ligase [Desulfatiglans sp.]